MGNYHDKYCESQKPCCETLCTPFMGDYNKYDQPSPKDGWCKSCPSETALNCQHIKHPPSRLPPLSTSPPPRGGGGGG